MFRILRLFHSEEETVEENVKTSAEQSIEEAYQSANSNYVTPIRPTRPPNMNATYLSGRGKNCPAVRNKVKYEKCLVTPIENKRVSKASFVVANWGISTTAQQRVQNPILRQLAMRSYNVDDMGEDLHNHCRMVFTDEGGSVVRLVFFPGVEINQIIEFASSLHNRPVAEFLFKIGQGQENDDEIVVYYACPNDNGFFEYHN